LAGDSIRLKELQAAIRQYLAWKSIWDEASNSIWTHSNRSKRTRNVRMLTTR
jgi:hypothetical protein